LKGFQRPKMCIWTQKRSKSKRLLNRNEMICNSKINVGIQPQASDSRFNCYFKLVISRLQVWFELNPGMIWTKGISYFPDNQTNLLKWTLCIEILLIFRHYFFDISLLKSRAQYCECENYYYTGNMFLGHTLHSQHSLN